MSFLKPDPAPAIAAPIQPALPPPVMAPQGSKPGTKSPQKTFLGTDTIANPAAGMATAVNPSGAQTGKTLLGA